MYLRGLRGLATLGDCAASYAVDSSYATPNVQACTALGGSVTVENGRVVCRVPQKCAVAQAAPTTISINNANVSSNNNANTVSPNIVTAVSTAVNPNFAQTQVAPQTTNNNQSATSSQQAPQSTVTPAVVNPQQQAQQNDINYGEWVTRLYQQYLGRSPDAQGYAWYVNVAATQGTGIAESTMANSAEAQAYRQKQADAQAAQQQASQAAAQQQAAAQAAAAAAAQGATPAQQQQAGLQAAQQVAAQQPVIPVGGPMTLPAPDSAPVPVSASYSGGSPASVVDGSAPTPVSSFNEMNPLVWVALAGLGLLVLNNNQRR